MNYTYDGTFEGLLTALRRIWQHGAEALSIRPAAGAQAGLFAATVEVPTDELTARAVWQNLRRWLPDNVRERLYYVFLAEAPDSELLIYRYLRTAIAQDGADISEQWIDDTVRRVAALSRAVGREKHRMEAFVRFEQTRAGLYHATIAPLANVLPLIAGHFARRYADQAWLIYDERRRYGICNDGRRVQVVRPETAPAAGATALLPTAWSEPEPAYQHLWQTYYRAATIAARRSPERHRRHLPKRYWRYLTEKRPTLPAPATTAPRPALRVRRT